MLLCRRGPLTRRRKDSTRIFADQYGKTGIMNFNEIYNYIEIGLWSVIGVVFLTRAFVKTEFRRSGITASVTFILFAISDIIEIHTGFWWKPWWLFSLKAGCVLSMLILFVLHLQRKTHGE